MIMKNKLVFIGLIILFVLIMGFVLRTGVFKSPLSTTSKNKLSVVTTLYPLYDFAKEIGKEKVNATLLLPPGVEPHAFEPKPNDIVAINQADLFVYTGEFMEVWAHDILRGVINDKLKVVNTSVGVPTMAGEWEYEHEYEEEHKTDTHHEETEHYEDGHGHHHSRVDPHIWLDFSNAQIMAENIAKALQEVDPQNAQYYKDNLQNYKSRLVQLDNSYKNSLAVCKTKTIVYGGHYAFGYLAKRYGLEYVAAQGFSPDAEPSTKDMIAMVEHIKKNNIKYVFYEELSSPKIAETLARETKAKMLLLNGAHNLAKKDYEAGVSYISLMEDNLSNLRKGLMCE